MSKSYRSFSEMIRLKSFQKMLKVILRYKWLYIGTIITDLLLVILSLVFAEATRRLFDMAPNISSNKLTLILSVFAGLAILSICFTYLNNWSRSLVNESIIYQLRHMVLSHLKRLPFSYHENTHSSKSNSIFFNELEIARNLLLWDILNLAILPFSFLIVGIYLVSVHPMLGLIAICIGPLQLISNLILPKKFKKAVERRNDVTHITFHHIGETLSGMREVKANQLENTLDHDFQGICKQGIHANVLYTKVNTIREIFRDIPSKIGHILGLGVGVVMVANNQIEIGGLVAFITLLDKVSVPFVSLVGVISNLQYSLAGTQKLFDLLENNVEEQHSGEFMRSAPPTIQFKNVNFEYKPGLHTLKNLNFSVPAGSSVALVGPSGSGKSTLVKLLYRFYDIQSGSIEIDGKSIETYSIDSLRAHMAMVSQDIFLFEKTIAENIQVGNLRASREEILHAAKLAEAYDFIMLLPNKFDSEVGERGVKLSQGQKQRIAIARAILKDAKILVLDEATSALDVNTEEMVQHSLGEWANNCTKIIIAHRLSTIKEADYVLFLDEGQIIEQGKPAELLKSNSRFRMYWNKQQNISLNEEIVNV
ncbi:ABC transporter ATP-binding protein [Bacillus cereus]|uniref:ABC transporter ATP-binding protein n=1 Tax=Bacillus cereus TaxID=1396 RepID=UPI00065BCBC0|nr:ABC transporter ATP-binding protein [Bacillus cereus]KMQ32177.1 hypothetical protein TU58_01435 [Bacillus cereus]